ncbi:unnamed protein product [Bursaphelenchus xylophilus]|uniref:(pine wood nematode) hypothetical protein n=1 Tax=Bursaphelenchus xylophilus TaxID=6326 RepID=A0A1I7RIY1_BURXY|nr:unnamed protein product [Bursaphelenchus xylophilus]CAG9119170.1 unnamed protein product [Bursaphelenchus xylophilus]
MTCVICLMVVFFSRSPEYVSIERREDSGDAKSPFNEGGRVIVRKDLNLGLTALPPFKHHISHLVHAKKYNLAACLIPKAMSTIMTAVLCFLNAPNAFRAANRTFGTEKWPTRFCKDAIESFRVQEWAAKNNATDFTYFTIVREPISRFIAAFTDKCYYEPKKLNWVNCFDCGYDMECVINSMWERYSAFARGENVTLTYVDQHLIPITWNCEFSDMRGKYVIFDYAKQSSPQYNDFKWEFSKLLKRSNVSDELIGQVLDGLSKHSSPHTTENKEERIRFERELASKPHLLRKLVDIYYYDFVIFGYPIPPIAEL